MLSKRKYSYYTHYNKKKYALLTKKRIHKMHNENDFSFWC